MFCIDQKYLQRLIESSPDIIVAVDHQGTIIYYNDGARRNLRYGPEEIIGEKVTRIYPSLEEARRVMKALREAPDSAKAASFETIFRSKDGELIPVAVSGSIIHDDEGNEIGSVGFARDIRLMRQREQLATLCEIAVSLAHEINNPLEAITNNLELLARAVERHLSAAELAVENEHLAEIRRGVARVCEIVRRLDEMSRKGVYETRDYMAGRRMADLAPREPPAAEPPPAPAPPANGGEAQAPGLAPPRTWPLAGLSILVLDDDVSVVTSLAGLLRSERCIVHTATRPSAAFSILRNLRIDVVLSDVVMPEMDGYEFYLRVKEERPALPVILMTAYYYDRDHVIKRSRMQGLKGAIFKKPINPQKLCQMLIQIREKSGNGQPAVKGAT